MNTRNAGLACGLIGLLVAMIAVLSKPAGAQDSPSPVIPGISQLPSPAVPPVVSPAPPKAPSTKDRLRAQSIDQLAEHLTYLRAEEKETLAVLKEKIREQSTKLQKLGIEPDVAPSSANTKSETTLPAIVPPGAELPRPGSTGQGPVDPFGTPPVGPASDRK